MLSPRLVMGFIYRIILLSIICTAYRASGEGASNTVVDRVESVTAANFSSVISSSDFVFIKFFVGWCIHCRRLAKPFRALAQQNPEIRFGAVDCVLPANRQLATEHVSRGFPTLKLFRNGRVVSEYKGVRDLDSMHKYLSDTTTFLRSPIITNLSNPIQLENFLSSLRNRPAVVATRECRGVRNDFRSVFENTARLMRTSSATRVAFAYVDKGLGGSCVMARADPTEVNRTLYWSPSHEEPLETFMHVATLQYPVGELTRENAPYVILSSTPLMIYFGKRASRRSPVAEKIASVVRQGEDVVGLVAEGSKFEAFRRHIGFTLEPESGPETAGSNGLALYFAGGPRIERVVVAAQVDEKRLAGLVRNFGEWGLQGTRSNLRSAKAPRNIDRGFSVLEVVTRSWKKTIERSNRDTLLYIYDDDCPTCSVAAEVYEKVAKSIEDARLDVKVARFNLAKNQLPVELEVADIPALFFLKAGDGEAIRFKFSGGFETGRVLRFIEQHARRLDDEEKAASLNWNVGLLLVCIVLLFYVLRRRKLKLRAWNK